MERGSHIIHTYRYWIKPCHLTLTTTSSELCIMYRSYPNADTTLRSVYEAIVLIIIIIIIIKHVLIKVTLSCQRHCRGTAQSLTSKKEKAEGLIAGGYVMSNMEYW